MTIGGQASHAEIRGRTETPREHLETMAAASWEPRLRAALEDLYEGRTCKAVEGSARKVVAKALGLDESAPPLATPPTRDEPSKGTGYDRQPYTPAGVCTQPNCDCSLRHPYERPTPHVVVDVRQNHIDEGDRFNPYSCPIALAARAMGLRTATMHCDGVGTLNLIALKGYARAYINHDAHLFGEAFDEGKPVTPRSFIFERATP